MSEHTRSKDFTPEWQQASEPVKPSPPSLLEQPEPPQDPQLAGQQMFFSWMPGIPPSQVGPVHTTQKESGMSVTTQAMPWLKHAQIDAGDTKLCPRIRPLQ